MNGAVVSAYWFLATEINSEGKFTTLNTYLQVNRILSIESYSTFIQGSGVKVILKLETCSRITVRKLQPWICSENT